MNELPIVTIRHAHTTQPKIFTQRLTTIHAVALVDARGTIQNTLNFQRLLTPVQFGRAANRVIIHTVVAFTVIGAKRRQRIVKETTVSLAL